jgi:hypothetical protein
MSVSVNSGHSELSQQKEASSDTILHGDGQEQIQSTNPNVLQRATLKVDLYLIPIVGMFCMSSLPLTLSSFCCSVLISCSDFLSFLVSSAQQSHLSILQPFNDDRVIVGQSVRLLAAFHTSV